MGIPTDMEYMREYCKNSNISPETMTNFNFYCSFAFFRMAAILQGVYKRSLHGQARSVTGVSSLGVPYKLTLSQTGRVDYAHHITTGTPGFSNLPTALSDNDKVTLLIGNL